MSFEKLKIAYSTCPNDTFMFDALINHRIDSEGLKFEVHLADIEELNNAILEGEADISKVSFALYPEIAENYQILQAGSALGFGNGPLVVSKQKIYPDELNDVVLAIPGKRTTANFLATTLFPGVKEKKEYLFSDIEDAVLSNEVDAGLIIHESRFTYQSKGLKLVVDLGELWEEKFDLPIPLGGIVIRRNLPEEIKKIVGVKISESIKFGFVNREASSNYIKNYAQELSDDVIQKHIALYVNDYSADLGKEGRNAISIMLKKSIGEEMFDLISKEMFVI